MAFVHLHLHTQYSLLDGAIKVKDLIAATKEQGMTAVAITDHGNLYGAIKFYQTALAAGIKPILGSEFYVAPGDRREHVKEEKSNYHLILLAADNQGYSNLCMLSSLSWLEGFYYKPRIDLELLRKYSQGLICCSACLAGEIPQAIMAGDLDKAEKTALLYDEIFGRGNFYLELQYNGIPEQETVNSALLGISQRTGIPVVATNDCHYLKKEHAKAHEVLMAIQTGKTMADPDRMSHGSQEFYFKSEAVMAEQFKGLERALEATVDIAARCNVKLDLGKPALPLYEAPDGQPREDYLADLARAGVARRLADDGITDPDKVKVYDERLETELKVINGMGYAGYYLIVWDFINWAKRNGVPVGPGRGSGAGSLAAYGLGITDVDPIRYTLLFERFLNPERISLPDFDIDFCKDKRDLVIAYVTQKYGVDHVGQIVTYSSLAARGVLKDVGRALGMSFAEVDVVTKKVPAKAGTELKKALESEPDLAKERDSSEQKKELFDIALTLEGLNRHVGIHAAGVVISEKPLIETVPLCTNSGQIITQFAKDEAEAAGLVKFDFLGLKTLTVIETALVLIEKTTGRRPDLARLRVDDPRVYETISSGETTGLFQMESGGFRDLLKRLKPDCIEDIIAVLALYRPGPLEGGMVDDFVRRKRGLTPVTYVHPTLEKVLKETYGVIVYQEQVMQIASVIAGYSLGRADILRKAMGKKKKELIDKERTPFLEAAVALGHNRRMVEDLFNLLEKFAEYGFNKSHSAAYAMVTHQTAWLKTYHATEFICALMTCDMDDTDKVATYMGEAKRLGIAVLVPDINKSERGFTVVEGVIRVGLGGIRNVGTTAIDAILEARAAGPFTGFMDFCKRIDHRRVNHRVFEALVYAGCFDDMGLRRKVLVDNLDALICEGQKEQKQKDAGQKALLFGGGCGKASAVRVLEDEGKTDASPEERKWNLFREREYLGFYLSAHPMDNYRAEVRSFGTGTTADLARHQPNDQVSVLGMVSELTEKSQKTGGLMGRFRLVDLEGSVEVLMFASSYKDAAETLKADEPVLVTGTIMADRNGDSEEATIRIRANQAKPCPASGRAARTASSCR
jgi:DNA polymerase-3 subunit alpha